MNLGPAEIAVVLLVALLVFGPTRLPELSRQLGGAMRELRRMQGSLRREIDNAMREEPAAPPATTAATDRDPEPDHTDLPPAPTRIESHDDGFTGPRDSFL